MVLIRPSIELGTLFDELAERGHGTTVHLSRPLDVAPSLGTTLTLPMLAGLVAEMSGWLAAAGVRRGDRVAIAKRNHWDYTLLCCAAARIGAVPASLSAHLAPATLETLLKRLEPALFVTDTALLAAARAEGAEMGGLVGRTLALDGPADGAIGLGDVRGHAVPAPYRARLDDPLAIMHTSGTTGVPKLVVHSTYTLMRRLAGFEARPWPVLGLRRDDTAGNASAYAHGRTLVWTAVTLWRGPATVVIASSADWAEARPAFEAHPPTVLETLPATFVRWQEHCDGGPFGRIRLFVSTYDAIHPPTVRAFLAATEHRRPVWLQGWGQSETGPLTFRFLTRRALARAQDRRPTTRHLGRPVPTRTRLRVVDPETLKPVPRGTAGLVYCRTKALCLGYVGEQERWQRKRLGAWWNTGDIGVHTRTGGLLLVDREVDALPDGSCLEIEDVVDDRLPEVLECVVLSAPERPVPVVVTATGTLDPDAWRAAVADLPALADPVVLTWDEVPRTGTGKVRRSVLRDRLGVPAAPHGTGRWT